jgi:hypothetical protein
MYNFTTGSGPTGQAPFAGTAQKNRARASFQGRQEINLARIDVLLYFRIDTTGGLGKNKDIHFH